MKLLRLLPALFWLVLWSDAASAHAIVLTSKPGPAETVRGDALEIEIRFNSRIDAARSSLRLFKPEGGAVALAPADAASDDTLKATATGLAPGAYRLHWQTLSPDGHISQGDIPFVMSR